MRLARTGHLLARNYIFLVVLVSLPPVCVPVGMMTSCSVWPA